jgi:hypothetical protein
MSSADAWIADSALVLVVTTPPEDYRLLDISNLSSQPDNRPEPGRRSDRAGKSPLCSRAAYLCSASGGICTIRNFALASFVEIADDLPA